MAIAYQPRDIVNNQYHIVRVLGQGGFAITYEAIEIDTKSSVAIKVISLKQLENWKQIELFQREAEVLAKLEHRCIPKYIDYFDLETETDKSFYIVQELASGKSLFDLVESGWHTTEAEVRNIAEQILNILSYLHSLEPPVIHRDIKPNNLIYSDDGTIYLVDFGAVQNTYYNTLMQGSTVVGTYGYMAPEQFRGKAVRATDLYSLGATLLYLLTHRSPSELPQDTLKLNFRSSVNISDAFADWLEKILEPDLEDRFSSADVALNKLLASNKVKNKKLLTSISVGILCLSFLWGFTSYKWFFLSRLGFFPQNICSRQIFSHSFFEQESNINFIDTNEKFFILSCMVKYEKYENVKKFLATINDFSYITINSYSSDILLKYAIERRDSKILKLLINMGININVKNGFSETHLHIAVYENQNNAIAILIENGADVNARDQDGDTPLFLSIRDAVKYGKTDAMELLVKNKADTNIENHLGQTPLSYALSNLNRQKHRKHIKYALQLLIKNGANVNAKNNSGRTPLHLAVTRGNKDITELLIKNGANVNAKNNSGRTLLHLVTIEVNKRDIAQLLVENGADVNAKDNYGRTPLHRAVMQGNKDITELLIKNGADVNAKDNSGRTPLF